MVLAIYAPSPSPSKVQFGAKVIFVISDEDHEPIYLPRHRTCGMPTPILKRIRDAYLGRPNWSDAHHRRGSDADTKPPRRRPSDTAPIRRRGSDAIVPRRQSENTVTRTRATRSVKFAEGEENAAQALGSTNKGPIKPALRICTGPEFSLGGEVDADVLVIPPSPIIGPPTRTSSPPPMSMKRNALTTLHQTSETVTRTPASKHHRRTRSHHSFNLQSLVSALPVDYRLHVDLSTARPLLWCLLDPPSSRSVTMPSTMTSAISQLDFAACPGAGSLTVHTHPFFPSVVLPGTATVRDVLSGIYDVLCMGMTAGEREMVKDALWNSMVFNAMIKRVHLRGGEKEELRLDILDGFVMFHGLEVVKCTEGTKGTVIECQLHLRKERSWGEA